MGITIGYIGQLADPGRVDEMVREIQGFAAYMDTGWKTWTAAELVAQGQIKDTGLRGIQVDIHPRCEELNFLVDDAGRFVHHRYHACVHDPEERAELVLMLQHTIGLLPASARRPGPELDAFLAQAVTKNWAQTQGGGPAAHVQACNLVRFVRDRFAPDLEVLDSSGYFEHGRLDRLEGQMGEIDRTHYLMRRAADRACEEGVTSLEDLLAKLQRYMNEDGDMLH
jgi:hypothetical protein